jgi:DNA-binding CsgD family transcriptional regulator
VISAPSGDLIIFNIERSYRKGFVERNVLPALDALRPHLARSALLSVRLGLERARAMADALGRVDLPAAVLAVSGRVIAANPLFEQLKSQFVLGAGAQLAITYSPANDLLTAAVKTSARDAKGVQSYSIPVPATGDQAACVAHLIPVRRQARDIFSNAANVFVVTSLTSPKAPPAHILYGLFDLSPAEARVAQRLVEGQNLEDIATANSLSRETVRKHVKAVLAKTGTHRQAELVGLLTGVAIRNTQQR